MDPTQGPVAILWDMENCSIPSDVQPADVAINIRKALGGGGGAVTTFSAYGDFSSFPRTVREGCQRTGVKLIDVPNGRKDAADKAILVDMFLFALDNRPPSSVVLISGDVDFSHALHILGQRGYTIILVIPSGVRVSPALRNAGQFVWDWPTVSRGVSSIPSARHLMPPPFVGLNEISGHLIGCQISENQDDLKNEETFREHGLSPNLYNSKDISFTSQCLSKNVSVDSLNLPSSPSAELSSGSLASSLNKTTPDPLCKENDARCLQKQSRDSNGLKERLVKLLEQSGGCLSGSQIYLQYKKLFGQPLCVTEYGASKLKYLVLKFSDVMSIEDEGSKQIVYLKNSKACVASDKSLQSLALSKDEKIALLSSLYKDKGGEEKGIQIVIGDFNLVSTSTDELTKQCVVSQENSVEQEIKEEENMFYLKGQLVNLLEQYEGGLALAEIPTKYQKVFGQPLHASNYGALNLMNLLQKFSGVMAIEGEKAKKFVYLRKFQASLNRDEKGNGIQNDNEDARSVPGSSDGFSDYSKREVPKEVPTEKDRRRKNMVRVMAQFIKLLEQAGGCLAINRISQEYEMLFGQHMCVSEDGICKLVDLLQKFFVVMTIEGEGSERFVYLKNYQGGTANGSGKGILIQNADEELPEDKRVVVEESSTDKKREIKAMFLVKGQLMKYLDQSGGCLALNQISQEYDKLFGRKLRVSEYGTCKLVDLLRKLSPAVTIEGEGSGRTAYLNNYQAGPANATPLYKTKKGSGIGSQNMNEDSQLMLLEENSIDEKGQRQAIFRVKEQLMKLLEQFAGCLALVHISSEYQKFYGRPLCVSEYGACKLADLLQKFSNVMKIEGEGLERLVYLRNYRDSTTSGTVLRSPSLSKVKKGKTYHVGMKMAIWKRIHMKQKEKKRPSSS